MKALYKSLILLGFVLATAGSAWAASALIESIGGADTVTVKRDGKALQLKAGEALQPGDELSTDGKTAVDVRLDDRSLIRVGVNSSYKLTEESGTKRFLHRLLSGIVRVLVPKSESKNAKTKFEMHTPEGTIGVRGTEFVVIRSEGETKLKGLEGEVMFGPVNADFSQGEGIVMVARGFESSIRKGGKSAAKPSKFSLKDYLRQLDRKNGVFAPLAARAQSNVKARSRVAPKAAAKVAAVAGGSVGQAKPEMRRTIKAEAPPAGLDPNQKLVKAAYEGDIDGLHKAIAAGANVNFQDEDLNSVLHVAAVKDRLEIIQLLLERYKAKVDPVNKGQETPLLSVVLEQGDHRTAQLLLEHGADLQAKDASGRTALEIAKDLHKTSDNEAMVKLLSEWQK
jgi:hypothetical protein